jgi:hypothetical protein
MNPAQGPLHPQKNLPPVQKARDQQHESDCHQRTDQFAPASA